MEAYLELTQELAHRLGLNPDALRLVLESAAAGEYVGDHTMDWATCE